MYICTTNIKKISMHKDFVPYELAVKLKELGFDELCFAFYQEEYKTFPIMVDDDEQYRLTGYRTCKNSEIPEHYTSVPIFSQAFRWFREKYNLLNEIAFYRDDKRTKKAHWYFIHEWNKDFTKRKTIKYSIYFKTYEEAEVACLNKLIEIAESQKTK